MDEPLALGGCAPCPCPGRWTAVPPAQSQHATRSRPAGWGKAATHHCWTSFSVTARENRRVFFQSREVSQGWADTGEAPPCPPHPTPRPASPLWTRTSARGEQPRSRALLGHTSRGGTAQPPPVPTALLGGLFPAVLGWAGRTVRHLRYLLPISQVWGQHPQGRHWLPHLHVRGQQKGCDPFWAA